MLSKKEENEMAFLQVEFFSQALEVASAVNVLLPEGDMGIGVKAGGGTRLPKVLYLLHGYSDDHTIWMRRTSVERYAAAYPLAVIMPAVNHSFYCNEPMGERYWDYISEELPQVMHSFFRLSDRPEDTFAAGLSMGGYGALKLGLSHPERFAAVGSFSGAVRAAQSRPVDEKSRLKKERAFGKDPVDPGLDLFHLLKVHGNDEKKPRLYVSCGTEDTLFAVHQAFVPAAEQAGWDLTHREAAGFSHEWAFWDEEIRRFIPWMLKKEN